MVNVYKQDGKILLVGGKVATSERCCCGSFSCPSKTCSDLPPSFSANVIFQNYLTQYSPKNLTFTDAGGGVWFPSDNTATAAGCPNIEIGLIIYCEQVTEYDIPQPSLLAYDLSLICPGFQVTNGLNIGDSDLIISTDTGESLTSDPNCDLIIPTFYINFVTPLTFLSELFLNVGIGDGCNN
jgi:hypothetical protein